MTKTQIVVRFSFGMPAHRQQHRDLILVRKVKPLLRFVPLFYRLVFTSLPFCVTSLLCISMMFFESLNYSFLLLFSSRSYFPFNFSYYSHHSKYIFTQCTNISYLQIKLNLIIYLVEISRTSAAKEE